MHICGCFSASFPSRMFWCFAAVAMVTPAAQHHGQSGGREVSQAFRATNIQLSTCTRRRKDFPSVGELRLLGFHGSSCSRTSRLTAGRRINRGLVALVFSGLQSMRPGHSSTQVWRSAVSEAALRRQNAETSSQTVIFRHEGGSPP